MCSHYISALTKRGFRWIEYIGKGSFGIQCPWYIMLTQLQSGTVSKVQRIVDGKMYAMKEINIRCMKQSEREEAVNEIRILASVRNPSIIK